MSSWGNAITCTVILLIIGLTAVGGYFVVRPAHRSGQVVKLSEPFVSPGLKSSLAHTKAADCQMSPGAWDPGRTA